MSRAFRRLGIAPPVTEPTALPFGEWLPDLPERDNPGAIEALNVIPAAGDYAPFPSLNSSQGPTLVQPARGAIAVFDNDGSPNLYAACQDGVFYTGTYSAFVQVLTNLTPLSDAAYWQFVRINDSLVVIHPQLAPQAAEVGGGALFSPLGGSPPTAGVAGRIGNFLVLGNLSVDPDDGGAKRINRIRWSGFDNIDSPWVTDPATQADFQDLPAEGGAVVGITGRELGVIFQERLISRMSYVGLPTVFEIETVEQDRGALNGGCLIDIGGNVFYIANDGFFLWNGTGSVPIGDKKVNEYFFRTLNYAERRRILGAVDYKHGCVLWAYPSESSALTQLIIYSYREQRWARAETPVEYLFSGATLDISLDDYGLADLDDEDLFPTSLDDEAFAGGKLFLAGFDTTHSFGIFDGDNLAATLDTSESSGPNGTRLFTSSVRPLVDTLTAVSTVQIAKRDQLLGQAVVFGQATAQEITGECPVLDDARYMRFRVNIPAAATWLHARGVEIYRMATGRV